MRSNPKERGSALVEFSLCTLFWIPLLLGTWVIGLNLVRAVQVTEVCRDAGHMYANGVDFSQTANQSLLVNLASGLSLTSTGNAVVILSKLIYIGDSECKAGGYTADTSSCPNYQQIVFAQQMKVGNSTLIVNGSTVQSAFGTPPVDSSGNVSQNDTLTNKAARAPGFSSLINLNASGQYTHMSEMYVSSTDYNFWNFLGNTGIAARSIF